MQRLIQIFAILFGCATLCGGSASAAPAPAPLTNIGQILALSKDEANRGLPADIVATVTYYRDYENTLFVQDGGRAIFVSAKSSVAMVPGDRVRIKGTTRGSYRPIVVSHEFTVLGHGALPAPVQADFGELIRGERDSVLVSLRGRVVAADLASGQPAPRADATLQLRMDGGYVNVALNSDNAEILNDLLDAEVEVTGVAGGKFDGKMQQTGVSIHVASPAGVVVLKRSSARLWDAPVLPIDRILTGYRVRDLSERVHVQGTVTYYQPGSAVVLENGKRSLWVWTLKSSPLRIGDWVDASGFPDVINGFLTMSRGELRDSGTQAPIVPQLFSWRELAVHGTVLSGHHYDLVSIEGQVAMEGRVAAQDEYILVADGHPFSAIFRHPYQPIPGMKEIPLGSKVRVTGICMADDANSFNRTVPFEILLRSPDDVVLVARPSLLSVRNLVLLVGFLFAVLVAAGFRGWTLEHRLRRQTAALAARIEAEAALEKRRSRILEEINGACTLAEILEQIAEMISSMVGGAPCWCEVSEGATLGNRPPSLDRLHVVRQEIPGRNGPPLGWVCAAFETQEPPNAPLPEALTAGAGLATLAIETRKLYSDLRRRSEFDLLTDTYNRFSLERQLQAEIERARQNAGIFGLIYIDLDEFKQVNDLHGHQVGDLLLQEVTLRMKRQLRPQDMLARLGGDEFAALVPAVRNRLEIEEIALRLERSLDEPMVLDRAVLHASVSVGFALYPEDGSTRDELLNAADASMYVTKNMKHQGGARFAR